MKISGFKPIYLGLLVGGLLSLAAPSMGWASDHLLSVNGATVSQNATLSQTGSVTTPLTLTVSVDNVAATFGQNQALTMVSVPLKMCKEGTKDKITGIAQLEWLDQGTTVVGVTGTLTSGNNDTVLADGYRLVLTMANIVDTYTNPGPCTVSGAKTYSYTAGAEIDKQDGNSGNFTNKLSNTYNFWNVVLLDSNGKPLPEPGTMALLLSGSLALVWLSRRRKTQVTV